MEVTKQSHYKEIAFLFFATLALSYFISPIFKTPQTDRQVFVYGSMTLLKGGVPYKDFFDHKPPLIYLILSLGWIFKWWGIWIVGVVAKWIAAIFLYKVALVFLTRLSILVPLVFLVVLLDPFIICMGSFTREYTAIFIAITLSLILLNPGKTFVLTGVMTGLTFFTQQEEILALCPFIIWHLFTTEKNTLQVNWGLFFKRVFQMLVGFMFIVIPLVLWLYSKDALYGFWDQAFLYNFFIYLPNNPIPIRISNSLSLFYHSRIGFFIIGFLIVHFYLVHKSSQKALHFAAIITLLLFTILKTVFSRLGEMYNMQHYFMGYSAIFAISALLILSEWNQYLKPLKWRLSVVFFFLLSSYFLWENAVTSKFTQKEDVYSKRIQEILPYVQEVQNKDGQLFVFRSTAFVNLYNELNCLSPSKWLYPTPNSSQLKFNEADFTVVEIINSIEANRTLYIVDVSVEWPLHSPAMRSMWNKYLDSNYTIIKSTEGYTLLKRKIVS